MFKSLALSAFVAASSFTGLAAQAAPTQCALRSPSDLIEFSCDHVLRTNSNGHKVNDVTFFDGGKRHDWSIVFWTDRAGNPDWAEAWHNGDRIVTNAYRAKNGSWCIDNNSHQLCIF